MKFDRQKFFNGVRSFLKSHGMTLTQKRTDALEGLITNLESGWTIPEAAYALATVFHETAHTFEPIYEYGPRSYFNKYEPGTRIGKNLGNTEKGDGYRYRGAGYVQITGRANYRKFGIEDTPEAATDPRIAFNILSRGMHQGLFTGKKLSDYISDTGKDYKNARKIINGTDKAALIAGYANQFEDILRESKTSAAAHIVDQTSSRDLPTTATTTASDAPPTKEWEEGKRPNETNVQIDNAQNVNVEKQAPPPQNDPVTVTVETPSIWAKVGAGIAAITGIGINFGNLVTTRLNDMTLPQLGYVLGGVAILGIGLWLYDRSAKRAHERTLAKMVTAADPAQNTIQLREPPAPVPDGQVTGGKA